MDNVLGDIMSGGLSDYDKRNKIQELDPLVEELIEKLEEINIPAALVIGAGLLREEDGLSVYLKSFVIGRKENGDTAAPGIIKAIGALLNDKSGNIIFGALALDGMERFVDYRIKSTTDGSYPENIKKEVSSRFIERQKLMDKIINDFDKEGADEDS